MMLERIRVATICGAVAAALSGFGQRPGLAQDPDRAETIRRAQRAVVVIRTYAAQGDPLASGSGVVIDGGRILTNAHVLEGASRAEVYDQESRLVGTTDYVEQLSTRVDVAVIPPLPNAISPLRVADVEPDVGDDVIVIGSPMGLTNTVSTGIVSGYRTSGGTRLMQITAPISQGSSGGPVLNVRGEIIGLSVARLENGQNLNFAVPLFELRAVAGSPRGRIAFPAAKSSGGDIATSQTRPTPGLSGAKSPTSFSEIVPGVLQTHRLGEGANGGVFDDGTPFSIYAFKGNRGQSVTFVAVSDSAPARLALSRFTPPSGFEVVMRTQPGQESRTPSLSVVLPADGDYVLYATTAQTSVTPPVTIAMATNPLHPASTNGRWTLVDLNTDLLYYVDRSSVRRMGPRRHEVWVRLVNYRMQSNPVFGNFDETLLYLDIDCGGNRYRAKHVTNLLAGRLVYDAEAVGAWAERTTIVPGSVVGSGAGFACSVP